MKKGFTIIELLVASALLGMLVTILTMIFNQSSIAWRAGVAGISELGNVRYTVGAIREVADNAFVYNNKGFRMLGLWDGQDNFRNRTCDTDDLKDANAATIHRVTSWFYTTPSSLSTSGELMPRNFLPKNVGTGQTGTDSMGNTTGSGSYSTYTVNVKCSGPDRKMGTWDDIWSFPDDPSEW